MASKFIYFHSPVLPTAEATAPAGVQAAFDKLVDDYFDFHFQFQPTAGTQAGLHQYDTKLEDSSALGDQAEIDGLQKFQGKFASIQGSQLSQESEGDLEILTSSIQARLLELQSIQMWKKDPDTYVSDLSYSIFMIMRRNFAPQEDRLRSVIARERADPPCPRRGAAKCHESSPGVTRKWRCSKCRTTSSFSRNDVPAAFPEVHDPALLAEFKASNQAVIDGLEHVQDFMRTELLPVSNGDFRLGAENYPQEIAVRRDGRHPARPSARNRLRRSARTISNN